MMVALSLILTGATIYIAYHAHLSGFGVNKDLELVLFLFYTTLISWSSVISEFITSDNWAFGSYHMVN